MAEYKLGEIETIFADIIWDNEPITSRRLTELASKRLNWKRTTTYTILKRFCDRELFRNDGGKVASLVSRKNTMPGRARCLWRKPSTALCLHS